MISGLSDYDTKNKNQNWVRDGVEKLNKEVLEQEMLSDQVQIAINKLSRYIKAGTGAIYLYDVEEKVLNFEASYAYIQSNKRMNTIHLGEGIVGQVASEKKPILLTNVADSLKISTATNEYTSFNTYTSPLIFKDSLVGVVEVASCEPFTDLQLEYFEAALSILAGYFYSSVREFKDKKRLEAISITDSLTGLFDRRFFEKIVPQLINRSKRNNSLICFALIDIDFFKRYNDDYGHQVGDDVLKKVANVFMSYMKRADDYCFRIGGEEFCIIFNAEDEKRAFYFMKKIKKEIECMEIRDKHDKIIDNVTISIGLTCKKATEIENVDALFYATDKLLYTAKETGRNKIVQNE